MSVNKKVYVKITALDFNEQPLEYIEGEVSSGSVNIDGNSVVRRTCNLSLIAKNLDITDYYWGIKTKFRLEMGDENEWNDEGIFVITSFSTTHNINNYSINISGKDKMSLLNGDLSGSLYASIDFGVEETIEKDGTINYRNIPIEEIIRESVHIYAQEPYHNIVINDLDEAAVELLEYKGEQPLYLLRNDNTDEFVNYTPNGSLKVTPQGQGEINISDIPNYDNRVNIDNKDNDPTKIVLGNSDIVYTVGKLEKGQTAGYRATDLTYAGDLISNIGESLTSIFDKIVKMLGNYEYFYNTKGQFIFQKKKNYLDSIKTNLIKADDESYYDASIYHSTIAYSFADGELIQSYQNASNITNIKNDFSVWGQRVSASGAKIPIHYRVAIGTKPIEYKEYNIEDYDWRELIYQMAVDFYSGNNYEKTGYEPYYVDLYSFWRELYNPEGEAEEYYQEGDNKYWNKKVIENPETLNFWFDFVEADNELNKFSIQNIGSRLKAVKDDNIKAIYYRRVPNLIYVSAADGNKADSFTGYTKVQIQAELKNLFSISSQGKSAHDEMDTLLYNHLYAADSITLRTLPIYSLQPNTRIMVRDELSGIDGEYIINKISYSLGHNSTMSITASKVPQRLK